MVTFGLVYITGVTASIGTIRTPTAAIFVFWVLMTGLLYDLIGILIGTTAASLSVLGLIVAENEGWLRQPIHGVGVTQWVTFTALFGFTSGLTYYITQGTKSALSLAEKEIAQRKQMEDQIRQLAFYDPLTKLVNRRLLSDRLSQAMAANKRSAFYGALIFLDLDDFKPINDTHGHATGDLLLIEVARRLTNCVRDIDTVARFGGDEFVVMISDLDADEVVSKVQAGIVAQKIQNAMSQPFPMSIGIVESTGVTFDIFCTASIGVAVFNGSEVSQDKVIGWADAAMYQAKKDGFNLVRFHEEKASVD
jgi:diguanylate cyclase (GGDEF)-like protein